jgi:hypothetical protein
MRELLFASAHVLPDGNRIIDPKAFIEQVRKKGKETLGDH